MAKDHVSEKKGLQEGLEKSQPQYHGEPWSAASGSFDIWMMARPRKAELEIARLGLEHREKHIDVYTCVCVYSFMCWQYICDGERYTVRVCVCVCV